MAYKTPPTTGGGSSKVQPKNTPPPPIRRGGLDAKGNRIHGEGPVFNRPHPSKPTPQGVGGLDAKGNRVRGEGPVFNRYHPATPKPFIQKTFVPPSHYLGGAVPGATYGNLTKGRHKLAATPSRDISSVSSISNPHTRTHVNPKTLAAFEARQSTHNQTTQQQRVLAYRQGKNALAPGALPPAVAGGAIVTVLAATATPILVGFRTLYFTVRGIFSLGYQPQPRPNPRGTRFNFYGGETEWSPYGPLRGPDNPLPPGPEDIFAP